VIYAYGTEVPSSSAVDADLAIHAERGVMQFNFAESPPTSTSLASLAPSHSSSHPSHHAFPVDDIPLLPYQRYIFVHAAFCILGFLVFLPAGVLLARYLRTFSPAWFQGHWVVQFAIGMAHSSSPLCCPHGACIQRDLSSLWVLFLAYSQFQRQEHDILTTNTR